MAFSQTDLQAELNQVKQQLHSTERELSMLRRNLPNDDMYLRQVAQNQYHLNNQLLQEQCAQQGVIYSPFRGGNTAVEAFKEKIDFKEQKTALKKINSPYLSGKRASLSSINFFPSFIHVSNIFLIILKY